MQSGESPANQAETANPRSSPIAVRERTIDWVEVVTGAAVAAVGAFAWVSSSHLALLGTNTIGPGLVPQSMGVALVALGAILIASGLRASKTGKNPFTGAGTRRVLLMLAALLAMVVLLPYLGFIVSAALFLAVVFFGVQRNFAWPAYVNIVALPIVFWLVFVKGLRVPLPAGIFGF